MAREKQKKTDETFRQAVGRRLVARRGEEITFSRDASAASFAHLDEDALAAFVEGSLSRRESAPLVAHLVACAFCRRATSELVRLESQLAASLDAPPQQPQQQEEPGRIRRLLDRLAARVLPATGDDIVFAYHAPAEDFAREAQDKTDAARGAEKRIKAASSGASPDEVNASDNAPEGGAADK